MPRYEYHLGGLLTVVRETRTERYEQANMDYQRLCGISKCRLKNPDVPQHLKWYLLREEQYLGLRLGWWRGKEDATRSAVYFAGRRINFLSGDYYPHPKPRRLYFLPT